MWAQMSPAKDNITYVEHALAILDQAIKLSDSDQRFALVVSIAIEGGAARSVGSLAVITQTGDMTGYLSNGCIDQDIVLQGIDALETGAVRHIRYGAGSPFVDLKLPCGGALELVIDPTPDIRCLRNARDRLRQRQTAIMSFCPIKGVQPQGQGAIDIRYAPQPRLVLAGRGAILRATANLAVQMEFELHIASPDIADLAQLTTLQTAHVHEMTTPSDSPDLPIDAHTAVVLLFHDHEWEQQLLLRATRSDPFFIGAMGSQKTHAIRLQKLGTAGLPQSERDKIHGPIGLVPSLRNASSIAISALAEIIAVLPVAQQRIHPDPAHQPAAKARDQHA